MAEPDYSTGLDQLFALITPDLHKLLDPGETAAIAGWGTMFTVAHYARGIRTLHDAGDCAAVAPLLRSLLEYTVGTMWLADARSDAVDVLNCGVGHTQRKLVKALNDTEGPAWRERLPAEAVANLDSIVNAEPESHTDQNLLHFTHLLQEYDFPQWIAVYNVLSSISHLSNMGAQRYVRQAPETFVVSHQPIEDEVPPCLHLAFALLLDAMAAYNELLRGQPWTQRLEQIAAEHDAVITRAKRKVKGAGALRG